METPISLSQIGLYNPQRQSAEVTEKLFVARQKQFESLLNKVLQEKVNSIPQHHLIVGHRGMGKTTMLKRMEVELHKPQYHQRFIPLLFPEEQYNVKDLTVFWLNCLDALADSLELENKKKYHDKISDIEKTIRELSKKTSEMVSEDAYKYLMNICRNLHRRPVLLVDNIGLVFSRLDGNKKEKHEQWALRKPLSENGAPIIVSAGVAVTNDVINYGMPFYDFFQIQYLNKLCFEEFTELLENLSDRTQINSDITTLIQREKPRLQTLYHFTGGNPRTAVMLFKLLVKGFSADINDDLDALVDEVTPLYKSKFEELPPQQQIIIDAIAMNWHPIPFRRLAMDTGLAINQLSPQLKRLSDDGWIETVEVDKKREKEKGEIEGVIKGSAYSISERFFNIWFLIRRSNRRHKKGVYSLSEFLECLYGPERMTQEADRFLQQEIMSPRQIMRGLSFAESKLLDYERKNKVKDKTYDAILNLSEKEEKVLEEFDIPKEVLVEKLPTLDIEKIKHLSTKIKTDDAEFWNDLGISLQNKNQYEKAIVCYLKSLEIDTDDAVVYYNMGIAYDSKGNYDKAIVYYQKAIELNPDYANAYNNIGGVYHNKDNYDKAIECFRKAIELNPDYADAYYNMGIVYDNNGNYDKAIAYYQKAIELNPDYADAYNNMGNSYANKGDYNNAIECYEKAIELNPDNANAYNNIGSSYDNKGDYNKAIECYEKTIELNPDDADAYYNMGNSYTNKGDYNKAMECYEKTIELNPDDAWAYGNIGVVYDYNGNYDKAIEYYQKVIELTPDDAKAYYNMGVAYRNKSNYDKAIECYQKAIELKLDYAKAYYNLQELYRDKLGRISEAKDLFNKIKDTLETDDRSLQEALFELHNRNEGSAKEYLSKALQIIDNELPKSTMSDWYYFAAICLNLNYGSWFLAILGENGYDVKLSPYYTAIQALEIERQDSKNGQKDAELYLKNRAIEISEPARMIMEKIRKYM